MRAEKRLEDVLYTYEKWWEGELDRPLIPAVLTGLKTDRDPPKYLYEKQRSFGNLDISPEDLIDGVDYELSCTEFLGDAYPLFNGIYSGPGVTAAFLGADIKLHDGRIWFFPKEYLPLKETHFEYLDDNIWFNRVKDILSLAKIRWGDSVVIGMPDLGGVMDILATFRGTENLLMDLIDSPDEVIRARDEITVLWHRYYDELREYTTKGYNTDWSTILSKKRSYMTQCDFSYMIGTDMFNRFVYDELVQTCDFLERGCYHLDGIGQIKFLDQLLEIKGLDLVQWIPGDGPNATKDWFELYCRILDAGKHLQIMYDSDYKGLDDLIAHYGSGKNIVHNTLTCPYSERDKVYNVLTKYGAV